jgi:hypothetical protein
MHQELPLLHQSAQLIVDTLPHGIPISSIYGENICSRMIPQPCDCISLEECLVMVQEGNMVRLLTRVRI